MFTTVDRFDSGDMEDSRMWNLQDLLVKFQFDFRQELHHLRATESVHEDLDNVERKTERLLAQMAAVVNIEDVYFDDDSYDDLGSVKTLDTATYDKSGLTTVDITTLTMTINAAVHEKLQDTIDPVQDALERLQLQTQAFEKAQTEMRQVLQNLMDTSEKKEQVNTVDKHANEDLTRMITEGNQVIDSPFGLLCGDGDVPQVCEKVYRTRSAGQWSACRKSKVICLLQAFWHLSLDRDECASIDFETVVKDVLETDADRWSMVLKDALNLGMLATSRAYKPKYPGQLRCSLSQHGRMTAKNATELYKTLTPGSKSEYELEDEL